MIVPPTPTLQAPAPVLQVYIQEHVVKNFSSAQTITIDLPDGSGMTLPLRNVKGWQKITVPSKCTRPEQKITVTFTPSGSHSTVGYGFKCGDMIEHSTVVYFRQVKKTEVAFGETSTLTPAMKKALDIFR